MCETEDDGNYEGKSLLSIVVNVVALKTIPTLYCKPRQIVETLSAFDLINTYQKFNNSLSNRDINMIKRKKLPNFTDLDSLPTTFTSLQSRYHKANLGNWSYCQ